MSKFYFEVVPSICFTFLISNFQPGRKKLTEWGVNVNLELF